MANLSETLPTVGTYSQSLQDEIRDAAWKQCSAALSGNDGSHDVHHVRRVVALVLKIAAEEKLSGDETFVAEIAGILHDVNDRK